MGPHTDREESARSRRAGDAVVLFSVGDSADFVLYPEPHMWPGVGSHRCCCGLAHACVAGAEVRPIAEPHPVTGAWVEPSTGVGDVSAAAFVSDGVTREFATQRVASAAFHEPSLLSGHKRPRADMDGLGCGGTGLAHAEPVARVEFRKETEEHSLTVSGTAMPPKQSTRESFSFAGGGTGSPSISSGHKLAAGTERPIELLLRLNSGDVVMFGGMSRLIKHAVNLVHKGSKPPDIPMIPGPRSERGRLRSSSKRAWLSGMLVLFLSRA